MPERHPDLYTAWRPPFPEPPLEPASTALLIVDMQRGSADPAGAMCSKVRAAGLGERLGYYEARLKLITPNIARLLELFRRGAGEAIHIRIRSMTRDGRDRGPSHKRLGHLNLPDSEGALFVPGLEPIGDELVFDKTAGSPFISTNLAYVLRNMGIRSLVVTGVVTTGCVLTTVTDAADLGFHVALVEDGCAALVEEMHQAAVRILRDVYAKVMSTEEVAARLRRRP